MKTDFIVHYAPLLPSVWLYAVAALGIAFLLFAAFHRASGTVWRTLVLALCLAMLANPVVEHAEKQPVPDIALLVVDDSASQNLGERRQQIADTLPVLRESLKNAPDLEWRELHVTGQDRTALTATIANAMAEIPPERRAGAIVLSDGQVHDISEHQATLKNMPPLHLLLTGQPDEQDRRLELITVPRYGVVGQSVTATVKVMDYPRDGGAATELAIRNLNGEDQVVATITGQELMLNLPITHAGDNVFTLAAPPVAKDVTLTNNRAVIRVQGVREKLRVLLVSGAPHPVERTWRNWLRADPAVELVHFTILRPPSKQDATPMNEMSLIGFPVQELFEEKLKSFDVVIFDRFHNQGMLPMNYFENIAQYVEAGGAFLDASGASFVTPQSLAETPLGRVLPSQPLAQFRTERFVPQLTERGREHPVTQELGDPAQWGAWYHQTETQRERGEVLLAGLDNLPLLVLDEVGKGRVAQLHSDSMWLWARGHQGGGPATELLRRIAHWLMREPELEADRLRLEVLPSGNDYTIRITRPTAAPREDSVRLTAPDGTSQTIALELQGEKAIASQTVTQTGAYLVTHNEHEQIVQVGDPDAPEMQNVIATAEPLQPLITASGGGSFWLAQHPQGITIKRPAVGAAYAGKNWLGLRRNEHSVTTHSTARELLPAWAWLALIMTSLMLCWRREGR